MISTMAWMVEFRLTHTHVYFLSGNYRQDVLLIQKILSKHKIRIVHAHFTSAKENSLFKIVRILYSSKVFMIMHLHNHYYREGWFKETIKSLVTRIDLYIGCSESVAVEFKKSHPGESDKTTFVTNAIDFNRLEKSEKLGNKDFQFRPTAFLFLMFGFDYTRKGVDIVLDAMTGLVKDNPDCYLLISLSRNKEGLLKKVADRLGEVPPWLRLLDAREDISTYFQISNYFISAAREEGFCTSLVEAAYCKIPIITSDIPGPNSLGIPHTCMFSSENEKELAKHMQAVMGLEPDELEKNGADQRGFVVKTYNLDVWADNFFFIYKSHS